MAGRCAAVPYGYALSNRLNSFTAKTIVCSYDALSMYTKPDLDLFLFDLYLCSSVDLGRFIQVYVTPESKPLLCQWNGSQELGWCAKQNTWLPGEMTWQELKHQTYRKNVCFEIPETWLSLWFFGMLWFSHAGWEQAVTSQGHWDCTSCAATGDVKGINCQQASGRQQMYTWLGGVWLAYKIYFHHRIKSNYVYKIYNPWMRNV